MCGLGLGHWEVLLKQGYIHGVIWKTAHNELLQAVFEMGIGFAIIAIGYARNIIKNFRKDAVIPVMAIVIIFVNSLVHYSFHIATTMMIAITWFAVLEIELKEK